VPSVDVSSVPAPHRSRGARGGACPAAEHPAGGLGVRALDPRLVRRAAPVRILLGLDTGLGVATAILVIVQATLLARVVAQAFDGASLDDVAPEIVLLELVDRRLRTQPAALDGVDAGEIAAAGVQGVDGLRAYFGRYLPQVVLACV